MLFVQNGCITINVEVGLKLLSILFMDPLQNFYKRKIGYQLL